MFSAMQDYAKAKGGKFKYQKNIKRYRPTSKPLLFSPIRTASDARETTQQQDEIDWEPFQELYRICKNRVELTLQQALSQFR